ncbi:MAG: hypothetical protein Q8911_00110 [Bacillota bacterium]|nr:hypothetical protein [Bacillota bacterium]
MTNQKLTSPLFWTAIIGAVKIVLDTVGIQVIDNQKVDALANGLAAAAVLIGVVVDHGAKVEPVTAQGILDAVTKLVNDLQPIVTQPTISPVTSVVSPASFSTTPPIETPVTPPEVSPTVDQSIINP